MKKIFDFLFEEFSAYINNIQNDEFTLIGTIIGLTLLSVAFILVGIACIVWAGKTGETIAYHKRKNLTKLFGWTMIECGISRAIGLYCMWHNIARFNALLQILTGLTAMFTLIYIPVVLTTIRKYSLDKVKESLEETKKSVEKFHEITDTLRNK